MSSILKLSSIPSLTQLYQAGKVITSSASSSFESDTQLNDKICTVQHDITKLDVDAIVNAANSRLLGGGGVDGAIHRAAGRGLVEECRTLKGCDTGSAKITDAYELPCKKVIHAVGPIYSTKSESEPLLRGCYRTSLELAAANSCRSIAFSAISTGVYSYPSGPAAKAALDEVRRFLTGGQGDKIDKVIFCNFLDKDVNAYEKYFPSVTALPGIILAHTDDEQRGVSSNCESQPNPRSKRGQVLIHVSPDWILTRTNDHITMRYWKTRNDAADGPYLLRVAAPQARNRASSTTTNLHAESIDERANKAAHTIDPMSFQSEIEHNLEHESVVSEGRTMLSSSDTLKNIEYESDMKSRSNLPGSVVVDPAAEATNSHDGSSDSQEQHNTHVPEECDDVPASEVLTAKLELRNVGSEIRRAHSDEYISPAAMALVKKRGISNTSPNMSSACLTESQPPSDTSVKKHTSDARDDILRSISSTRTEINQKLDELLVLAARLG